jgi:hypothetical protein
MRIATRGEMNLHLADYHLESARLHLAQAGSAPDSSDANRDPGGSDTNRSRTDTNRDPRDPRSAHLSKAREHWAIAKEMIDRMGYHRRDRELAEIAAQVA